MKSFFFLLFSTTLFAQTFMPDTLFLKDGRVVPCLITSIGDAKIGFKYSKNISESIVLFAISKIYLHQKGEIYSADIEFASDIDELEEFISARNSVLELEERIQTEKGKMSKSKRWSFGVLYVPNYSSKTYTLDYVTYDYGLYYLFDYPHLTSYANNKSSMEVHVAYEIACALKVVLGCGYNSTFITERRYDSLYLWYSGYYEGSKIETGLKLLDINLGLKYYFLDLDMNKATAFLLLGIGKQFAFAEHKSENLFPLSSSSTVQDNAADFMKSLNSPWYFTLGAGTEYFFNESLSITANLRLVYSSVSGDYNYKYTSSTQGQTLTESYSGSELTTRVGLGVNFYF